MILRDRDTTPTPDGVLNERVYYLQNWRADVVALIKDNGDQLEQVRYEPYGTPFGLPAGDIDSNGDFGSDDYIGITGSYDIRKDVNMDGTISFADTTAAYNTNGLQTLGRGAPTSTKINNRKTYAAYEHLCELAGAKYDVRNRVLIAELGTWSRRDPLGYIDGMSLYQYVMSRPIVMVDEDGQFGTYLSGIGEANCCLKQCSVIKCNKGKNLAKDASRRARKQFKNKGLHNGIGDAYRHCFWSCTMQCEMGAKSPCPQVIGDCHEDDGDRKGQPPGERIMDTHNNFMGRKYGRRCANSGARCDACCNSACIRGLQNGELMTAPPTITTPVATPPCPSTPYPYVRPGPYPIIYVGGGGVS